MSVLGQCSSGTRLGLTPSLEIANQQEQPREPSHDALRLSDWVPQPSHVSGWQRTTSVRRNLTLLQK